jgi:hypothetical protein
MHRLRRWPCRSGCYRGSALRLQGLQANGDHPGSIDTGLCPLLNSLPVIANLPQLLTTNVRFASERDFS